MLHAAGRALRFLFVDVPVWLAEVTLFNRVLRSTSPTVVSLSILFEIPGAALIAALFLGQRPPLLAIPAAVLLLAGLALVIRATTAGPSVPVE